MKRALSQSKKNELDIEVNNIISEFVDKYPKLNGIIPNSFEAAEELGFFVVSTNSPENISGFTTSFADKYYLIVVNSLHTKARQNFSIWHEVYHWFTGDGQELSFFGEEKYSETEYKAETFASLMLMKNEQLEKDLSEYSEIRFISNLKLLELQYKYQVSTAALIFRISKLKDDKSLWSRKNKLSKESTHKENGFSGDLEVPTEHSYISPAFFEILLDNFNENKISAGYVEMLKSFIEEEF